jgi:hypothetical protein
VADKENPTWEDKTNFPVGYPEDDSGVPECFYQALAGRVYTLLRFADESVSRGEVELRVLENLVEGTVKEGWYSASGNYLGAQLPGSLA